MIPLNELGEGIKRGHYAQKQLLCSSKCVAWSHGSRFRLARELVAPRAGGKLLDYGCGDGSFLGMVADLFPDAVGADIASDQISDCERRLGRTTKLRFLHTGDLPDSEHRRTYDVVTCMETLEHCREAAQIRVLIELRRLVKDSGVVIISVPIEIGPALLFKQVVRRVAGWRRLGQYRYTERYSIAELLRMTFLSRLWPIKRPVYGGDDSDPSSGWHGHKGFNWKVLKQLVEDRFTVEQTRFSPFGWSHGLISSQCWFVVRPR